MTQKRWLVVLASAVVACGLAFAAIDAYRSLQAEQCYACQRAIHAHLRTVAVAMGRSRVFCCPACVLSEHAQEGQPIRITGLTAFLSGRKLSPNDVFFVKGSDVNMCARTHGLMSEYKREANIRYDRCSPSLLAFDNQSDAMQFVRDHGGEVLPFKEIASALTH